MADDYLPPVVAEIIFRTDAFETGAAKVRSDMATTAASVDASANKASESTAKLGVSAEQAANATSRANLKIVTSAQQAGEAARLQAAAAGKSAEEQAAAAGKAAEAFTVAQSKMTAAQKAAGLAAAEAAAAAKKSADEQELAYARAAAAAEVEGEKISQSQRFLGQSLNNAGIAMGGALGRPLRGFGRQIEDTEHKARSLTGTLSEVGKVVTYGGILGFVGAAYEGVKAAQAYQTSIAQIAADSGQRNAQQIGSAFQGTMGKSSFSSTELASAYAQVSQQLKVVEGSTLNASDAMKVMAASSDLAKGAQTNLGTATSAVAQVMQAYHLGVNQASQASDALYSTARATDSSVSAIAMSMGRLHSRLGAVTPSLKDVGGLMVGVAQTGLTGSRGILQVSSAIQTMLGGTTAVDDQLAKMHVGLTNASGGFVGMRSTITQLHNAFQSMSPQMRLFAADTLFGRGAAQVMLQVIDKGTASFQKDAQAADKAGSAHAAAAAQSKTLADQLDVIKSTIEDVSVAFGQIMIPVLEKAGQALSTVVGWFAKNKAAAVALGAIITGVLGAAVAVFVSSKIQALYKGLGDIAGAAEKAGQALATKLVPMLGKAGSSIRTLGATSTETAPKITSLGTDMEEAGAKSEASAAQLTLFGTAAEETAATSEAAGAAIVETATTTASGVDIALGMTGVGLVIVGLGVAITELATHWDDAMSLMKDAVNFMVEAAEKGLNLLISLADAAISAYNSTVGQITGQIGMIHKVSVGGVFGSSGRGSSAATAAEQTQGSRLAAHAAAEAQQTALRARHVAASMRNLSRAADVMITGLRNAAQDTGVAPLEQQLGIRGGAAYSLAHAAIAAGGAPSIASLQRAAGGSRAQSRYEQEIVTLQKAGLTSMVARLVDAHRAALKALSQQLVAQQALKDSTSLTLESTSLTDQTKAAQDAAATQVSVIKDQQAITSAAMQGAAKNISDAAAVMSAKMSAAATAITDATTVGQDRSAAIVQAMSDATQVQADILGERSLYGYQLIAQRLQVQLDATKEGFDKQIALQQEQVDEVKQHWDGRIAAQQIVVARISQHQDQLVSMAQQRESIVQMHADTLLGNAQQASDTARLAADMRTAIAQNAVTLSQSATPAQKQAAENMLTLAQAQSGVQTAQAAKSLQAVTTSTQLATTQAAGAYQKAQDQASIQEAKSQSILTKIQGQAQIDEAKSQAKLDKLNETMNKVVQKLQDQITLAQAGGGRRIRSDASNLAGGFGTFGGRGKGGMAVVDNAGPLLTSAGISAYETTMERREGRGKGNLTINGGVHITGAGKDKEEIVNAMYLKFRSLRTAPG